MAKLLAWIGATLVGGLGWWLGARTGTMTAFVLSTIGTGVGFYLGRRWAAEFLG